MAEIDRLFYTLSVEVDKPSVQQAQKASREVQKVIAGGREELEEFGGVAGASFRQIADEAKKADQELDGFGEGVSERIRQWERDVSGVELDVLDESAQARIAQQGRGAGEEAGRQFGRAFSERAERQGREVADATIEALKGQFRAKTSDAKDALFRGLIDEDEFRRRGARAAEEFNDGVLRTIRRLADRGALDEETQARLTDELKDAGRKGGRGFADEADNSIRSGLGDLPRWVKGTLAAGIVAGFVAAARGAVRVMQEAARRIQQVLETAGEVQALRQGFETLTVSRGLDPTETLERLRRAVRGTVTDMELMRTTNEALQGGLQLTAEDLEDLVSTSRRVGRSLGIDATESYQRFVQGIVRGRRQILDDLGVIVDWGTAYERAASELGKTTDALTEQEKVQARTTEVLRAGQEVVADLGDESLTAGDRLSQVTTAWDNLLRRTAEFIVSAPTLEGWLTSIGGSAEDMSRNIEEAAIQFAAFVDTFAGTQAQTWQAIVRAFTDPSPGTFKDFFTEPIKAVQSFGERLQDSQEHLRAMTEQARDLARIRSLGTLSEVESERAAIQAEILTLIQQGKQGTEEWLALQEQFNVLAERERQIRSGGEGGGPGATVDPLLAGIEEATDKHREFVRAFRRGQEEIGLEGFIEHLSEVSRILAESATESDALRESLEGLVDVEEGPGGMVQPLVDVTEKLRRFKEEAEEIVRSDASAGVRTLHLEQALQDLGLTFDQLRPTTVRWLQLWGIYINRMGEGADATSDAKDEAEGLEAVMSDFEGAARGVLSVADAAGVLSDELREVLRGAIDVADALQSIAEEGLTIGNIAQGLGGVVGLVSGIAGALPFGESERDKAVRENTRALRELRRNIDQLANLVSSRSGDLIEGLREVFDFDAERFNRFAQSEAIFRQGPGGIPDFILQRMEEAGVTISDLERLAEDAGIDIDELTRLLEGEDLSVDEVRAATEQFLALQAAVDEIDLSALTETVEGVLAMIEAAFEIFDIDDPAERLEAYRRFFLRFTNLPEELVEEAESFDLDTAEGRAAFEAWLQGIFRMLESGDLPEGALGELDVDEFIRSLLRMERLIDQAADAAEGPASESFQIFRGITELRASRIEGALTSIDLISRKQLGELISIREVLGGAEPEDIPILEPPSTGGNGLAPPDPVGDPPPPRGPRGPRGPTDGPTVDGPVVQVSVARLEAPVSIDGALTPTGEELAQVIARELGRGSGGALLRELQKALGNEFQGVDDALGRIREIVQ